jgi:lysophospholipase L1-like esterase
MDMKQLFAIAAIAAFVCIALTTCQKEEKKRHDKVPEEGEEVVHEGPRAVFIGNSITERWPQQHAEFFSDNGYVGKGIGGQVSAQILARFDNDAIALDPWCVVILAGTNDIAQNTGVYIPLDDIYNNIVAMTEKVMAVNIKPILCSILPVYDYPWKPGLNPAPTIVELNGKILTYASLMGIPYVDYHSALKDERGGLPTNMTMDGDGVHPNKEAYAIMEPLVKETIDRLLGDTASE